LVGIAALSRSIVRKHRSLPLGAPDSAIAAVDERTVAGLRRSVGLEVVLGIAVLAVTAVLVNAQPARSELTPKLFSGSVAAGSGDSALTVSVTIDPTLTPKGADLNVRDMSAKLVSADGTTSVPANLVRAGPNHFLTNDATITVPGTYKMLVEVTTIGSNGLPQTVAGVLTVPIR
jgi:hypothetical protein